VQGGYYGNALYAASLGGHEAIVQLLLEHNADVNVQGGYMAIPVCCFIKGYGGIVQLLLEHNADVNVQGGEYDNALQVASSRGHEAIVQLLLEHNADVNVQGGEYGNALQAASSHGHQALFSCCCNTILMSMCRGAFMTMPCRLLHWEVMKELFNCCLSTHLMSKL